MKKLFTLVALLAMFLGANAAEWKEVYKIDYSTSNNFPFYVMGYVPEWVGGVMTDYGADFRYATQDVLDNGDSNGNGKLADGETIVGPVMAGTTEYQKVTGAGPYWHQYFIADGINTGDMADVYTVKALVKASEAVTIDVNMGWGWGEGQQAKASVAIPASDDFVEVEWEYSGIGGASCNLVAQPGTATATIEWKSLVVGFMQKETRPTVWQEWLTSDGKPVVVESTPEAIATYMGNAETPWTDATVKFNDQEKNYLICAWSKEKGRNMNEDDGWDPFPADIELEEGTNNHVFVCHGQPATTEGDPSAWDNQFWIQSPKAWKSGEQLKIHFRYKTDYAGGDITTQTQVHKQNPSDYLIWHAIGDITFTNEWKEFDGTMSMDDSMAGGWSIAFNLNPNVKDAANFYFDDLSWQSMVLDEGYFVAGCNKGTGLAYEFDTATQFVDGVDTAGDPCLVATVGEKNAYVDEIMISTVRGNDAAFKGATIKVSEDLTTDPEDWKDYTEAANSKIALPGSGIWKIYLDTNTKTIAVEMTEGEEIVLKDVVTNSEEITVNALEREDLQDNKNQDGTISVREDADDPAGVEVGGEGHTGQTWDNQFWIIANREIEAGEETVIAFKYMATKEAKASTQCHAAPGGYIHWAAIGDVNFTTEWQTFEAAFTVPAECAGKGFKSIAFNLAEIKDANDYHIKDVQWYLKSAEEGKTRENLINATGQQNFAWKVVGGEIITGIKEVAAKKNVSTATYNLAGQRVSDSFKGIVIKDGKKFVK